MNADFGLLKDFKALSDRVAALERLLNQPEQLPACLDLTRNESALVGRLLDVAPKPVTSQEIMEALWPRSFDAAPDASVVAVYACKANKKLKPFGVRIQTAFGRGRFLSLEHAQIIRSLGR
jgi:two-component system cell cycle response regulator CtrA